MLLFPCNTLRTSSSPCGEDAQDLQALQALSPRPAMFGILNAPCVVPQASH